MTVSQIIDENQRQQVDTKITEVTVYPDRARVTRRGTITLTGTEQELTVLQLPGTLETESVRARGSGTVAVRLLGVRTEKVFVTEPTQQRLRQLTQRIRQLEAQKSKLQDQLASRRLQLKFVEGLSEKSIGFFASGLAKQQVGLNEAGKFLNFLGKNYNQYSSAITQYETQLLQLERQLDVLHRQKLQQMHSPRFPDHFIGIVMIEPNGEGEFELEISYVVGRASWKPLYDMRVDTASQQINLNYLAEIHQNTGEDWSNVLLTLSTAKPGLGTLPPKLDPWYVDVFYPPYPQVAEFALRKQRTLSEGGNLGMAEESKSEENEALPMVATPAKPSAIPAQTVTASISKQGSVVTFKRDGESKIPSDGSPHKTIIFSEEYPFRPEFIAFPRSVSFAYLQAAVVNPLTGATLLPGRVNIFRDNTFVGTSDLENIAPGQEYKLMLGIDEGVKIERELVERQVDKKLIGSQRRTIYAYRMTALNLRETPATLILREQLPVSRHELIKVRLTLSSPKIQPGEMGLLEWLIELPAQGKQEFYYQFVVEHPPELNVVGLDI